MFNMFIGSVITTFNQQKEKVSHNTFLTRLETEYVDTCNKVYNLKPKIAIKT